MDKDMFRYHDKNDALTIALINKIEPYQKYWEKSEKRILEIIDRYLEQTTNKSQILLDVGCGNGRLLPRFNKKFEKMVVIEPDIDRLNSTIHLSKEIDLHKKCQFLNYKIEDYITTEKFDCILCSHIIQHVSVEILSKILAKLRQCIKNSGALFLMTCHSHKREDYFAKDYFLNRSIYEDVIDKREFEKLIKSSSGELPIHFFTYRSLKKLINDAGFKIIGYQVFHILFNYNLVDRIAYRDILINKTGFLKQFFGRDIFIAAKPQ